MNDILAKILETKAKEIDAAKRQVSLSEIQSQARLRKERRDFVSAIRFRHQQGQPAVIAEVKKASPSKGIIRTPFDPEAIARSYSQYGATCLSVLTDESYFQGALHNLKLARQACPLPLLRKDFIIDPYQLYEAVVWGADCVLLIVSAMSTSSLEYLAKEAQSLSLDVLVEVHDEAELDIALTLETPLIGINNRNLRTFEVNLETTLNLLPKLDPTRIVVTESGISTQEDVQRMRTNQVETFLVGETFMRAPQPGEALSKLFGEMTPLKRERNISPDENNHDKQ